MGGRAERPALFFLGGPERRIGVHPGGAPRRYSVTCSRPIRTNSSTCSSIR
jgi:hypothetical protein